MGKRPTPGAPSDGPGPATRGARDPAGAAEAPANRRKSDRKSVHKFLDTGLSMPYNNQAHLRRARNPVSFGSAEKIDLKGTTSRGHGRTALLNQRKLQSKTRPAGVTNAGFCMPPGAPFSPLIHNLVEKSPENLVDKRAHRLLDNAGALWYNGPRR